MATIDSGVDDDSLISPQTLLNNIISAPPIETIGFLFFCNFLGHYCSYVLGKLPFYTQVQETFLFYFLIEETSLNLMKVNNEIC